LKNFIKFFITLLISSIFLIIFSGISCTLTPEGISILSGNYESPKFLELKVISENSLQLLFSTSINIENLKIYPLEENQEVQVESKNLGEGLWQIDSFSDFDCRKNYLIEGYVLDQRGNSLYFKDSFIGFNGRVPNVVINEIRSEYSKPKVEFIELKVLSEGNLGGMELMVASDGEENSYIFPSVEVKSEDLIVLHFRKIEDGCIDEIENDRELSTATESSSSIDLWIENTSARIAKSDVILLKNKRQGEIVDSVLYMENSATSWKTPFLSECAELALSSETWIGNPVNSDGLTATRTLSRVNLNKDASAWIVTATSKASPGKENSSQKYVAK
jgi:hypothetical protein